MNFIPCEITKKDKYIGVNFKNSKERSYFIHIESLELKLDKWLGKKVILGIQPEQIASGFHEQEKNPQIHGIECIVQVLEPTGPDTLVFILINGIKVLCRADPKTVKLPGETMKLMVDVSKVLFFDPETERRLEACG